MNRTFLPLNLPSLTATPPRTITLMEGRAAPAALGLWRMAEYASRGHGDLSHKENGGCPLWRHAALFKGWKELVANLIAFVAPGEDARTDAEPQVAANVLRWQLRAHLQSATGRGMRRDVADDHRFPTISSPLSLGERDQPRVLPQLRIRPPLPPHSGYLPLSPRARVEGSGTSSTSGQELVAKRRGNRGSEGSKAGPGNLGFLARASTRALSWSKALFVLAFLTSPHVHAASNFVPEYSLSWGGNIGPLNWLGDVQHGVELDQFVCSGFIYSANVGWIDVGTGRPANGLAYQNNSAADFGVNVGTRGELSGLAYGANIGWINFAPIGQPRLDLNTGNLSGFIYGANVGWINLSESTYRLQIDSLGAGRDSDNDGIPDVWEIGYSGQLGSFGIGGDFDGDGQSDLEEYLTDTDPTDPTDNLRIMRLSLAPDHTAVQLTWSARPTRQYVIQTRNSLDLAEDWTDSGYGLLSTDGPSLSLEVSRQDGTLPRYFRVRAVRPLAP